MVKENSWENRVFLIFIFIHVLAWTLAPTLTRLNLPLDTIEGTIWGKQLAWGYDKNPFLNAWLTELAILFDRNGATTYLMSQLSVVVCFLSVWLLAKKMLPPLYALVSLLILEGIQYFNFHAIDFSDNTLELGCFALTILFFYHALTEGRFRDWVLTGFFAGLSMMTKYYSLFLLFSMLLFLLYNATARQFFKKSEMYAGLCVFMIVIAPHFFWLITHHFTTAHYAFDRIHVIHPSILNHFIFPLKFLWEECVAFLPAFLLLLLLLIGKKPLFEKQRLALTAFNKEFLLFMAIGPFLLTLMISFILGIPLRASWGQPLLSFWGILLVVLIQPRLNHKKVFLFFLCLLTLLTLSLILYCDAQLNPKKPSSANFPGKIIANTLTRTWHEKYHTPFAYVAGERWLSGNISFYSVDRPSVFMECDILKSPWIQDKALRQNGAIFVWNLSDFYHRPSLSYRDAKARYPALSEPEIYHFMWYRNKNFPAFAMMVAYLPSTH